MKIVTWNMRRATASSPAWKYLLELDPDVALLQEVATVPDEVRREHAVFMRLALGKQGAPQRFSTAVVVRSGTFAPFELTSERAWVQAELQRFAGNLVCGFVSLSSGECAAVVSVYSPAWHIDPERLVGHDTSGVRLSRQTKVYLGDVMLAGLPAASEAPWVVAGDFNLSETFDVRRPWAGNAEFLERMAQRGYVDCLRHSTGQLTPTFRNSRGGQIIHQMDHFFASPTLLQRLVSCAVGDQDRVFGGGLSDHLPIMADFNSAALGPEPTASFDRHVGAIPRASSNPAPTTPEALEMHEDDGDGLSGHLPMMADPSSVALEPEPTASFGYHAEATIQIRSDPDPSTPGVLKIHEDNGDGRPLCGRTNRDWMGQPMYYVQMGPRQVTCRACARLTSRR